MHCRPLRVSTAHELGMVVRQSDSTSERHLAADFQVLPTPIPESVCSSPTKIPSARSSHGSIDGCLVDDRISTAGAVMKVAVFGMFAPC